MGRGEASEPQRRAQPQGCGGQSREIPSWRIGAEQHSTAREACLLTRQGGRGLGAEAQASVGSQGEDWGWLREHSLKGLVHHSLQAGSQGKSLDLPKRQETIVSGCTRRGDSEHRLNKLHRWAQATANSSDPRDGHETLTLLLQPPRSLYASIGHYPQPPPLPPPGACAAHHCQGPMIQGQLTGENTRRTSGFCKVIPASVLQACPTSQL